MIDIDCVVSALNDLHQLNEDSRLTYGMKDRIQILKQELELQVLYIFCFTKWNDSSFGKNKDSGFAEVCAIEATLEKKGLLETGLLALDSGEFEGWKSLSSELLENILHCKQTIKEDFLNFLHCLFQCECSSEELHELMSYTAVSLANLLLLKGDVIHDKKVKIDSLKEKLDLFKDVFQFTTKWCNSQEEMENFKIHIQAWAFDAACLCLLNWVLDEKEENMSPKMSMILSDLQQKIITSTPEVTRMCLVVLMASKPSAEDGFEIGELVSKFVDFLLGNLHVDLPKDGIQMLCSGLIFLITFLMDPPEARKYSDYMGRSLTLADVGDNAYEAGLILRQAAAAVNESASLISSLNAGEIKGSIAEERNILLDDFLGKVNAIKAEVRKLHSYLFLDKSSFNWPRINVLGLLDSLVENLREISIHFSKHHIVTVKEGLVSLRNLLKASNLKEWFMSELQNKHKKLKDFWTEIANVVYQAEMTISSFMFMKNSVCLDMLCLFDVTEEIKYIEGEVKRFQAQHMNEIDALNTETSSSPVVLLQTNIQTMEEVVVGFKNEVKDILDHLTSRSEELEIISIVGMGGIGKTTLAKKVYRNPSIKYHFTKCAWCVVSQSYNSKKLLLDILTTVTGVNDSFFAMGEEELANRLRKSLKGQKYLIVMDDIWDISAWNALKLSFPNDNNGSRIMLTSRIHNVVLEAAPASCTYPLGPLSEKESWELLKNRLFQGDSCPPNFAEVGRCIAKNCKGLPLAVVLVAGLLREKIENLDWWKQIGESLVSQISREGCADVLELSYNHLPEHLKPCFLYFGSFPEDKVIRVQKLARLWVSEGFIPKQEKKTSEIVAKEYLMDLVSRSLVIVTDRSSTGKIKTCRIHDMLREFCLAKGEEENFFKLVRGNDASQNFKDKHYRVSIQITQHWGFLNYCPLAFHSILFSPVGTPISFVTSLYFREFKFLRVLDLGALKVLCGDFPEEVTKMVLLRYLSIYLDFRFIFIPRTIMRLENLETLLIRRTGYQVDLPLDILRMKNLRHVDVGNCFPTLHGNVPPLENIQSFSHARLPAGEEAEIILRKIPKVRKLKCRFIEWGTGIPKLDFLNHLESLNVTHGTCSFPLSLKKLTLAYFSKPWTEISIIANLPNLEVLKLRKNAFIGRTWNMEAKDEKFLKLKFLELNSLDIHHWNASDEAFPCLECLIVEHCSNLEEIPSGFGNVITLRMIQVRWCNSIVARSATQIQEEQIDLGNEDLEVLIL